MTSFFLQLEALGVTPQKLSPFACWNDFFWEFILVGNKWIYTSEMQENTEKIFSYWPCEGT